MAQDRSIDWQPYGEPILIAGWGEPNRALSKKNELRWGSGGSKSFNREKGTFFDHEAGEGGGIVDFMRKEWGEKWQDTLLSKHILSREDEAALGGGRRRSSGARTNGNGHDYPDDYAGGERDDAPIDDGGAPAARPGPILGADGQPLSHKPRVTWAYDYTDKYGAPNYQVLRKEWIKDGQRRKTFTQRRRSPGGGWINNLNGIEHQLYLLPQLTEAVAGEDLIFITEGEKDADRLTADGLVATTNSGGAKTWTEEHAKGLSAHDVVVLIDNDDAGRARLAKIGPSLVKHCKSVRALDLAEFWEDIGEKDDVSDWFDRGGGTAIKLATIAKGLPAWRPMPPVSKFGAKTWAQTFDGPEQYTWLVKGIIPEREAVLIYGAPQTGKSFECHNLSMHVALGRDLNGRRVRKSGVVYCAFEGGKGFMKRQRAFGKAWGLDRDANVDIVVLTRRADLFSNDVDIGLLIAEILAHAATMSVPLGLVVLDTWSAATPGANENASEDVSKIRRRVMRVVEECNCSVIVVHHKPAAGGRPRGHGSLTGDFETTIDIDWDGGDKKTCRKDGNGRPIRKAKIEKQRDDEADFAWNFVLRQIDLGSDGDGDAITSCVSELPAAVERETDDGEDDRIRLQPGERILFDAFIAALKAAGRAPPPHAAKLAGATEVVTLANWREQLEPVIAKEGETAEILTERARKAVQRAAMKFQAKAPRLLVKDGEWVGRTERKVFGIDRRDRSMPPATKGEDSPLMSPDDLNTPF